MERRAQEVIDRCWADGRRQSDLLIHDVGAGGLSNAVPEAVDHSKHGAQIELREVANAEPGMSPMGIWCNEAQERYVLIVGDERIEEFQALCERERCPVSVIGTLTDDGKLVVNDRDFDNRVVDMPMEMLLGNPPKMERDVAHVPSPDDDLDLDGIELREAALRVLRFPAVADKSFLIHIGDRTVGGLSVATSSSGPGRYRSATSRLLRPDSTARPVRRWRWVSAHRSPSLMRRRRAAWRWPSRSRILPLRRSKT